MDPETTEVLPPRLAALREIKDGTKVREQKEEKPDEKGSEKKS